MRRPSLQRAALRALLSALSLVIPMTANAAQQDGARGVMRLEARVDSLRREWSVPGVALAVVRNDSVLIARGYGIRDTGGAQAVDEQTLFAIGSTTKAFTATAMAVVVGEGMVGWDDRVIDHLPGFALSDPWLTSQLTIRDLLAHRSGLPMANLMWLTGQLDGDELMHRLRHLEPSAGFRSGLSYQNVLYAVAGRLIAERTEMTWDEFVTERLLRPLGMRRTRTGLTGLERVANVASPHVAIDGGPTRAVPFRDICAIAPAGAILSSAADMAQWLRFQLGAGAVDGRRLADAEALAETHRPQTLLPLAGPLAVLYPDATMLAYGMGWVVSQHRGHTMLDHSGGIDGMTSLVALIPERKIGVAILTNVQSTIPPYWMLYPVLDHLLGHEPDDRYKALRSLAEQGAMMTEWGPARTDDAPESRRLGDYTGDYDSEVIGAARVALLDGVLVFSAGSMSAPLEPWHFETFRARWLDAAWRSSAGPGWVTFRRDLDGSVRSLDLTLSPGDTWTFERRHR